MAWKIYKGHLDRKAQVLRYYRRHASPYAYGFYSDRSPDEVLTELWAREDHERKACLLAYQKRLDGNLWYGSGCVKLYKRRYHRLRRSQSKSLCRYALYEDEERFERISPEGFMGAIGWDIL